MKTVLLLGGSAQQTDSLIAARRIGYRTVLCDWDPDCPGRPLADKFYAVSTLDRDAVLDVARREHVDGVACYASDAPAPVAAWVAHLLDLPGNPPDSVSMLCDKGRFRAFLGDNGFSCPKVAIFGSRETGAACERALDIGLPVVVKPVDSAGSRGVTVVCSLGDIPRAVDYALANSRKGEVIIEEYLETATPGRVIEAELFVEQGRIVSWGLMSAYRDLSLNGVVPSCYVHPMDESSPALRSTVSKSLEKLVERAGITQGAMNIELIHSADDELFIIDVGPRNGGNFLPSFISRISGDDLIQATLRVACGEPSGLSQFYGSNDGLWVQHMHYSQREGRLVGFETTPEYENAIIETHLYKEVGSKVSPLSSISDSIGVSLLHFPGERDADSIVEQLPDMCRVVVEPCEISCRGAAIKDLD